MLFIHVEHDTVWVSGDGDGQLFKHLGKNDKP